MADKDGPARLSAPADAGQNVDAEHRQSRKSMKEIKPYLAHSKSDWDREAGTRLPRQSDTHSAPRGLLDRSLQAQLGRQLRAIFSDVEQEPIPDRFIKLLEALEDRE
jgi:hypothetical protein